MADSFSDGIDKFRQKLQNAIPREGSVSLTAILNPSFMAQHTAYATFESFLTSGGYGTTADEFMAIPNEEFDEHVRTHSPFASWLEMQRVAGEEYMAQRLRDAGL